MFDWLPRFGRRSEPEFAWLASLSERRTDPLPAADEGPIRAALERAARCYAQAGWDGDACQIYEATGNLKAAAAVHERARRHDLAAELFRRAKDWYSAIRCYRHLGRPLEVADCQIEGGDPLEAAWTLAFDAHSPHRAEAVLESHPHTDPQPTLGAELIRSCSALARGDRPGASLRLRNALVRFRSLPPGTPQGRLLEWAAILAERLERPDLAAQLHATAVEARLPGAERAWEAWSQRVLGSPVMLGNSSQPPG